MSDFIDYLDGLIKVFTPEGSTFPRFGSIYFFLIFMIIYSISYGAISFIPMFKSDKNRNFDNIRLLISLSIGFLGATASFMFIVNWIQLFATMMISGFIVSLMILVILPKKVRESKNTSIIVGVIGLLIGIIFTLIISGYENIFIVIKDKLVDNWQWSIFIISLLISFLLPIILTILKSKGNPPVVP